MIWTKEAMNDLREFKALENFINEYPVQMEDLDAQLKHPRSAKIDAIPTASGGCRTDDAWLNIMAKKERLAWNYGHRVEKYMRIKKALALLSDDEFYVLNLFYIDRPMSENRARGNEHVKRCMDKFFCSRSEVYRRSKAALRVFTIALYGIESD